MGGCLSKPKIDDEHQPLLNTTENDIAIITQIGKEMVSNSHLLTSENKQIMNEVNERYLPLHSNESIQTNTCENTISNNNQNVLNKQNKLNKQNEEKQTETINNNFQSLILQETNIFSFPQVSNQMNENNETNQNMKENNELNCNEICSIVSNNLDIFSMIYHGKSVSKSNRLVVNIDLFQ